MLLYAKSTLLKADGTTKISMMAIHVSNTDVFTDEMAAELLDQLLHTEMEKVKAVSASAKWISPMEVEQIIKNLKNRQ